MESLDQKTLLLFGQEYHPPRLLLLQYRNAQQSEHQVPLEIQKMINKFVLWKDAGLFSVLKDELIIQLKKLTQSIFGIALDNETALMDNM